MKPEDLITESGQRVYNYFMLYQAREALKDEKWSLCRICLNSYASMRRLKTAEPDTTELSRDYPTGDIYAKALLVTLEHRAPKDDKQPGVTLDLPRKH